MSTSIMWVTFGCTHRRRGSSRTGNHSGTWRQTIVQDISGSGAIISMFESAVVTPCAFVTCPRVEAASNVNFLHRPYTTRAASGVQPGWTGHWIHMGRHQLHRWTYATIVILRTSIMLVIVVAKKMGLGKLHV